MFQKWKNISYTEGVLFHNYQQNKILFQLN